MLYSLVLKFPPSKSLHVSNVFFLYKNFVIGEFCFIKQQGILKILKKEPPKIETLLELIKSKNNKKLLEMKKIIITSDQLIQQAKEFSFKAHSLHYFPCGKRYSTHLETVVSHCKQATIYDSRLDEGVLLSTAYLHDTVEDTEVTNKDIFSHFGQNIANAVLALTKNKTLPKKLQIQNSLQKISPLTKEVWIVKMADRIANLQQTLFLEDDKWTTDYKEYYRNESILINETLGKCSNHLSQKLSNLITIYNRIE